MEHYTVRKRIKYFFKHGKWPKIVKQKLYRYEMYIYHKDSKAKYTSFSNDSTSRHFDKMMNWFIEEDKPAYYFEFSGGAECYARVDISSIKIIEKPYYIKTLKEEKK